MKLKRIISFFLSFVFIFSIATVLVACKTGEGDDDDDDDGDLPIKYSITYNLNYEGAPAAAKDEYSDTQAVVRPADPSRAGDFIFEGWYTAADGAMEFTGFGQVLTADIIVYAKWTQQATITFELNYEGSPEATSEKVDYGDKITAPAAPEREGFDFDGWYSDELLIELYDFDEPVTGNVTLYASWLEAGVIYRTVTFYYFEDYIRTQKIVDNSRISALPTLELEGYELYGWYTNDTFTTKFLTSQRITANITLYAKIGEIFVFEAEDIDFSDLSGPGYSGETTGKGMILPDNLGMGASNGYFVSFLYAHYNNTKFDTTLNFVINASEAVSDARLYLRLSGEYANFVIDGYTYEVLVNGGAVRYEEISFMDAKSYTDQLSKKPFEDYAISIAVSLRAGENNITLRTANTTYMIGTMVATAPLVDCMKISACGSTLTWGEGLPKTNNYEK